MSATVYKISIAGALLAMLAGCSLFGQSQAPEQQDMLWRGELGTATNHGALEACSPNDGAPFHFRKNILVVGTVGAPGIASDLPGLPLLTSKRLQTHLDALERFNVMATHETSFESNIAATHSLSFETMAAGTAARVRQLGREYSTQFIVKLELEDLTVHSSTGWFPKLFQIVLPTLLPNVFKANGKRNMQMKLYIYDTEYGALFKSLQYEGSVSGNVVGYREGGYTVSYPWFDTDVGSKVDETLKAMSVQINEALACIPFSTQVTEVNGNAIKINAGFLNGIRPGETLRAYPEIDIQATDGTQKQQGSEMWIKVTSVLPNYSMVTLNEENTSNGRLETGDLVRAW